MVRRRFPVAVVAALLAAVVLPSVADAGIASSQSTNWAGYVVRKSGVDFKRVSASWVVPAVDCSAGEETYSASWVGIGGYARNSRALEQVGTESDCTAEGNESYSAWYEVVPDVGHTARITVNPGDIVGASVTVTGRSVRMRLVNTTTGASFTKTVRAAVVDTSSAEWIVEAPSLCTGTTVSRLSCEIMALADFGSTGFSAASATTTRGFRGPIVHRRWKTIAIALRPSQGERASGLVGGAVPGLISAAGDAFGVDFAG